MVYLFRHILLKSHCYKLQLFLKPFFCIKMQLYYKFWKKNCRKVFRRISAFTAELNQEGLISSWLTLLFLILAMSSNQRWIGIISMVDWYLQFFWNIVEQYLWVNQRGSISIVHRGSISMLHRRTISTGTHSGSISIVHSGLRSIVLKTVLRG